MDLVLSKDYKIIAIPPITQEDANQWLLKLNIKKNTTGPGNLHPKFENFF